MSTRFRLFCLLALPSLAIVPLLASDGPAGPDLAVCGNSAIMQADPLGVGQSGSWVVVSGAGTFESPNSPTSVVTGLAVGENIFNWTLVDNGLPSNDQVIVTSYNEDLPAANAGPDSVLCLPVNSLQMQATPAPFPAIGNWFVFSGNATISSFADPNSLVTIAAVGTAVLQWTVYNGECGNSVDEVMISLQECVIGVEERSAEQPAFLFDAATGLLRTLRPLDHLIVQAADGRRVLHVPIAPMGTIDLSGLPSGAYLISAEGTKPDRVVIGH